ncbi:MAG: hypothetical protein V1652_02210 [bacterium]
MNKLKLAVGILSIAFSGLVIYFYYTITVVVPKQAEQQCAAFIDSTVKPQAEAQCKAAVDQVMAGLNQYQELVTGLSQVPACAPYIPVQGGEQPAAE